jgi:hypothetical protein
MERRREQGMPIEKHVRNTRAVGILVVGLFLILAAASCQNQPSSDTPEPRGTATPDDSVEPTTARQDTPPDATSTEDTAPDVSDQPTDSRVPAIARSLTPGGRNRKTKTTANPEEGPILLHDATDASGISFQHTDGSQGDLYIIETVASGLATLDYDLDGLIDIYFVNGAPLSPEPPTDPPRNRLYRNLGNWHFVDVTDTAGVGDAHHGLGATVVDYDNDGDPDIYVSNMGENVLYQNNGDGTFRDATTNTGTALADEVRVGAGVCGLDVEGDGDLDLFVANYLKFRPEDSPINHWRGQQIYVGPERFPAYPSVLLRNQGDGTFTDASEESGLARFPGYGMGITCGDFDQDGTTDVFVGNDGGPGNFLFYNDGKGVFDEAGMISGVAYSGAGLAHGSMGVDCGDFDHDGKLDLFVTSYQNQLATLYQNLGDRIFEDVTQQTGAGVSSFNQVTWGCGIVDLDNDARRDIFYASGHLIDNIDGLDDSTSYLATPVLMHATGDGQFEDVSDRSGTGMRKASVGRGAAFEDLDNDGDLDVVIHNSRRTPTLLRNDSLELGRWLEIQLVGTSSCRDAVGSQVTVQAGEQQQLAEVHSGRAFQSHFGTRLHFGLGSADRVEQVEVRWLGGDVETFTDIPTNARVVLVQGSGAVVRIAEQESNGGGTSDE